MYYHTHTLTNDVISMSPPSFLNLIWGPCDFGSASFLRSRVGRETRKLNRRLFVSAAKKEEKKRGGGDNKEKREKEEEKERRRGESPLSPRDRIKIHRIPNKKKH